MIQMPPSNWSWIAYCSGTSTKMRAPKLTISDAHFAVCDFLLVGRLAVEELAIDVARTGSPRRIDMMVVYQHRYV